MTTNKAGRPALGDDERMDPRPIRCKLSEWQTWQAAAKRRGKTLSAWLRELANRAAKRK
jgi:hypothetical protein